MKDNKQKTGAEELLKMCGDILNSTKQQSKQLDALKFGLLGQVEQYYESLPEEKKKSSDPIIKEMKYLLNNCKDMPMAEVLRRIEKLKENGRYYN